MNRWIRMWAVTLALGWTLTGCHGSQEETVNYNPHFNATVVEIGASTLLVEPTGGPDAPSEDQVMISSEDILSASPVSALREGDTIRIVYNGDISETVPAKLDTVFAVYLVGEDGAVMEISDRIPMVMVDGILYLDTGKTSTLEHTCGTMDGEITSSVDSTQQPTVDGQSNFGTGYGYQYGVWGTINLLIDDTWWVFETEERRQALQNDPWGLVLATLDDATPTGLTLACTQSGGHPDGELWTGSFFVLEQLADGQWLEVPAKLGEIVWTDEAWQIYKEDTQYWPVSWEAIYGELAAGTYRIGKDITNRTASGDSETSRYYAEFTISN